MYSDCRGKRVSLDDREDISCIQFLFDANRVSRNTVTLRIPSQYKNPSYLNYYTQLSEEYNFAEEGLTLRKKSVSKYMNLFRKEGYELYSVYPFYFSFSQDRKTIRESLNSLCEKGFLSSEDLYHITGTVLTKYEKVLEFAKSRTSSITVAQEDLIRDFLKPYLEALEEKLPKAEIKLYIKCLIWFGTLGEEIHRCSPNEVYNLLYHYSVISDEDISQENLLIVEEDDISECLTSVASVVSGYSGLETALLQSGPALPNKDVLWHLIENMINESDIDYHDESQ